MIIKLTRAEGMHHECDQPHTVHSFQDASSVLRKWSDTVPKTGGYHKVDFNISLEGVGVMYHGRFDLNHWSVESPCLKSHVIRHLEYRIVGDLKCEGAEELLAMFKDAP